MTTATDAIYFSLGIIGSTVIAYIAGLNLHGINHYEINKTHDNSDNEYKVAISPFNESFDGTNVIYKQKIKSDIKNVFVEPDIFKRTTKGNLPTSLIIDYNDNPANNNESSKNRNDVEVNNSSQINKHTVVKTVSSGNSFISLAREANVNSNELTALLYRSRLNSELFNLQKDQKILFNFENERLISVDFISDGAEYTRLTRQENGKYKKQELKFPEHVLLKPISFVIKSSLVLDGSKYGLSGSDIVQIVNALKYKVDFSSLHQLTKISVVLEEHIVNNKTLHSVVKAVILDSKDGVNVSAFYYKSKDTAGYYDINGLSLAPSFLRHPIEHPIVSSKFNLKRKHPILNIYRPHWGTDYANWKGTPIRSIGDGIIKYVGRRGSFGNVVIIKHNQEIETLSAHMNGFAKNIKKGMHVKKGQVVGFVGKTGLATGYNLHFELRKDGKRVDSLKVDLPTIDQVDNKMAFTKEVGKYKSMIWS